MSSGSSGALSISPGSLFGDPAPVERRLRAGTPQPPPVPPRSMRPIPLVEPPADRTVVRPRDPAADDSLWTALRETVGRRELFVALGSSLLHMLLIVALALWYLPAPTKSRVLQASLERETPRPDLGVITQTIEPAAAATGPRLLAHVAAAAPVPAPQPVGQNRHAPVTLPGLNAMILSDAARTGGGGGLDSVSFFGSTSLAQRVVFIVDASASMEGMRFERAKEELLTAVSNLTPRQRFYVFFFADKDYPMRILPMPETAKTPASGTSQRPLSGIVAGDMLPLNERSWEGFRQWVDRQELYGDTRPQTSLQKAFRMNPDVIYLLTDGEFNDHAYDYLMSHKNYRVRINTIGFDTTAPAREALERIAKKFRGEFIEIR